MSSDYSVVIEYIDLPNACEGFAGREMLSVEADGEVDARDAVSMMLAGRGFSDGEWELVGIQEGLFDDEDAFWAAVEENEAATREDVAKELKEAEWEEYLAEE